MTSVRLLISPFSRFIGLALCSFARCSLRSDIPLGTPRPAWSISVASIGTLGRI
jgi:hypothetical protein